jgi:hypothetical protein
MAEAERHLAGRSQPQRWQLHAPPRLIPLAAQTQREAPPSDPAPSHVQPSPARVAFAADGEQPCPTGERRRIMVLRSSRCLILQVDFP